MFTPKWKKEAQHLVKGARKFVHYKRDLLKPGRVEEIESRRTDLNAAIATKDLAKVDEASKQLRATCENSLPKEEPLGWFEENVEVMFVAIVIALGLRAYYLQPFRIPTGSMQPTLNGIIGRPMKEDQWPAMPTRAAEWVLRGRSYVKVVNDRDRHLALVTRDGYTDADIRDTQFLHFFSRGEIRFVDSEPLQLPAPANPCRSLGLDAAIRDAAQHGGLLRKGLVLCEGIVDTGDLVLVDKFSYHFRNPKRGEVFVFDTVDIEGIQKRGGEQGAGSHYIKRLCGVPGDTLSIQSPHVLIDGKIADEFGMQRVSKAQGEYSINPGGYDIARSGERKYNGKQLRQYLAKEGATLELAKNGARPGMREYAALGDNTGSSLDSRYWGPVKEFNLVGPALFSLWPITTGHWGFIH